MIVALHLEASGDDDGFYVNVEVENDLFQPVAYNAHDEPEHIGDLHATLPAAAEEAQRMFALRLQWLMRRWDGD